MKSIDVSPTIRPRVTVGSSLVRGVNFGLSRTTDLDLPGQVVEVDGTDFADLDARFAHRRSGSEARGVTENDDVAVGCREPFRSAAEEENQPGEQCQRCDDEQRPTEFVAAVRTWLTPQKRGG